MTTKGGSLSTVRDFGPDHIAKWKDKHWLIAVYKNDALAHCKYGSPAAMAPWIEEKWKYIEADFELAKYVPAALNAGMMSAVLGSKEEYSLQDARRLHKNQYSAKRYRELMDIAEIDKHGRTRGVAYSPNRMLEILKDRARYIIERGSTLNNHIYRQSTFPDGRRLQLITPFDCANLSGNGCPLIGGKRTCHCQRDMIPHRRRYRVPN